MIIPISNIILFIPRFFALQKDASDTYGHTAVVGWLLVLCAVCLLHVWLVRSWLRRRSATDIGKTGRPRTTSLCICICLVLRGHGLCVVMAETPVSYRHRYDLLYDVILDLSEANTIDRSPTLTININYNRSNHKHCHVHYCKRLPCGEILTVIF